MQYLQYVLNPMGRRTTIRWAETCRSKLGPFHKSCMQSFLIITFLSSGRLCWAVGVSLTLYTLCTPSQLPKPTSPVLAYHTSALLLICLSAMCAYGCT